MKKKKKTCKTCDFYVLFACLLITIVLLIAVNIYYRLKKCQSKQKHLLPYYVTNDKLKKFCINNIS